MRLYELDISYRRTIENIQIDVRTAGLCEKKYLPIHYLLGCLSGLLVNQCCSVQSHGSHVNLSWHWLAFLSQSRQQFEVVDVERWRGREENPTFLVERVAERMWRTNWHDHVVASFGIHNLLILAGVAGVRNVEPDGALGYEKGLVVHFVPVRWRARGLGWKDKLSNADAVV